MRAVAVVYWAVAVLTLATAAVVYGQAVPAWIALDPTVWGGFAVALALSYRPFGWRSLQVAAIAVCILSVANSLGFVVPITQYGDGAYTVVMVANRRVIPHGLATSALAISAHEAIARVPVVVEWFGTPLFSTKFVLRSLGSLGLTCAAVVLLRRHPRSLRVALPVWSPVWLLFGAGYVEVYPIIAPLLLVVLVWMFDRPLDERGPYRVGAAAALLFPIGYYGFAPLVLLLLAAYAVATPLRAVRALAVAAVVAVAAIWIIWPAGVGNYLAELVTLPAGGDKIFHAPYRERASLGSPFFELSYLGEAEHLLDWSFMWFFGAGLAGLPLLWVATPWWLAARVRAVLPRLARDSRLWLGLALMGAYLVYSFVMIPRLGPVFDVDLFFTAYVMAAFFGGLMLDDLIAPESKLRELAVVALLANSAVILRLMAFEKLTLP